MWTGRLDGGGDGTPGWRLVEVVRQMPEVKCAAAAQGVRRFWRQTERGPECAVLVRRLREEYQ